MDIPFFIWLGNILIAVKKIYLTFNRLRTSYLNQVIHTSTFMYITNSYVLFFVGLHLIKHDF